MSDGHGLLYVGLSYAMGAGVLHRPISGGAWVADTAGLGAGVPFLGRMIVDKSGNIIGSGGGFVFQHVGWQWQPIPAPTNVTTFFNNYTHAPISIDSNGVLFVAYDIYGAYYTTNNGKVWTPSQLQNVHFDYSQAPLTTTGLYSYGDTTYATTYLYGIYALTATKQAGIQPPSLEIDLDSVAVNHERDSSIQVANSGNDSLIVTNVTSSNPDFTASVFDKTAVAPGNPAYVYIQFKPTKPGVETTLLTVASNATLGTDTIRVYGLAFGSGGVSSNSAPAESLRLDPPTPNPMSGTATVRFATLASGSASLKLYDMLGREVATLFDGRAGAGIHDVNFPASNLPSGAYQLTLRSLGQEVSVPVIVRK